MKRLLCVLALLLSASLACERVTETPPPATLTPTVQPTMVFLTDTPYPSHTPVIVYIQQTGQPPIIITQEVVVTHEIVIYISITSTPSATPTPEGGTP